MHRSTVVVLVSLLPIALSGRTEDLLAEFKKRTAGRTNPPESSHCPKTSYQFPSNGKSNNYLRVKTTIPGPFHELTVCFWLTRYEGSMGRDQHWVSYANWYSSKEFVISIKKHTMYITLRGRKASLLLPVMADRTAYHICVAAFASTTGTFYVFMNGKLAEMANLPPSPIYHTGVLIVGQSQEGLGFGFHKEYAVHGKIANCMFWNRVLDHNEILKMIEDICLCPSDSVVTLETQNVQMSGGVTANPTGKCS